MAPLLSFPKNRQPKHAARTPLWRQFGFGRPRVQLTDRPVITPPAPEPATTGPPPLPVSAEQAREVVERLFPAGPDGLYPLLDWRYDQGRATAQVDPGLVPDAARNIVLAYASALDASFMQETAEDRLHLRVSRAVDGVQVTVWADITPDPQPQLALPAAASVPGPALPIEEGVRRCVLDETQTFPAITDDMPDPRSTPDGNPVEEPTDPDHVADPDPAATSDDSSGGDDAQQENDEPDLAADEDTASTDDTSSTPLPPGDEDEEEEAA